MFNPFKRKPSKAIMRILELEARLNSLEGFLKVAHYTTINRDEDGEEQYDWTRHTHVKQTK